MKFLNTSVSARWKGKSTKGSKGNKKSQVKWSKEKNMINDKDIFSCPDTIKYSYNLHKPENWKRPPLRKSADDKLWSVFAQPPELGKEKRNPVFLLLQE